MTERLGFYPVCIKMVTDNTGLANLSLVIPGVFSGLEPFNAASPGTGRLFSHAEVWSDSPSFGDILKDIFVEDSDSLLVGEGKLFPDIPSAQTFFPAYPVIKRYIEQDIVESENIKPGLWVNDDHHLVIKNFFSGAPEFIPSGFYIKAAIQSGPAPPLESMENRIFRVNFFWAKI